MAAHIQGEVIRGEYSDSIIVGPPERPEQPRAEDPLLDGRKVQKKFQWTPEQFASQVTKPNFPIAGKLPKPGLLGFTLVWRESVLDRWATEQRALAAEIVSLLGR